MVDGALESPMIKQSSFKEEKDFTVLRVISSSGGTYELAETQQIQTVQVFVR